ncbi:MAG: hypothetical protein RLZ95_1053 [Bacteroidota bacterium]
MKLNWKGWLLWSNQFYGICAASLALASGFVLLHQLPILWMLLLIHLATVLFYTHAYIQESKNGLLNERVMWYQKNKLYLIVRQIFLSCICLYIAIIKLDLFYLFLQASISVKFIFCTTILLALTYYLPNLSFSFLKSYRAKGVFKSLAIAWVWTVICSLFPIWLVNNATFNIYDEAFIIYFLQLFIYVLVLAILFDFKDMQKDQVDEVNTIVLKLGLSTTLKTIIIPLLLLYYGTVVYWLYITGMSPISYVLQGFLVILTYLIAHKVIKQKAIHANILLIDGLLILKAILTLLLLC